MKFSKEQLKDIGNVGLKIGKAIVVEGTKAVILKGTAAVITTSFEEGLDGVKGLKLDDLLKGSKKGKTKKIFKKTEEVEVEVEEMEVTKESTEG